MSFATVAEAEARIAEIESENKTLIRDIVTHKKGYKELAEFLSGKGFDVRGNLDEQWGQTTGKLKADADQSKAALDKMQKQMDKLQKANEDYAREREENTIRSTVSGVMKDIIGSEDLIDNWLLRGKLKSSSGKVTFPDGENETPIDKHVDWYKKNSPERIRVAQQGGAGSSASQGGEKGGQDQRKQMKKSEYSRLNDQAKKDFHDKGGEIIKD